MGVSESSSECVIEMRRAMHDKCASNGDDEFRVGSEASVSGE